MYHASTNLGNNVYVFGGKNGEETLNTMEVLNLSRTYDGKWSLLDLHELSPRWLCAFAPLTNSKLLLWGGGSS